jgi:uncharacterized repeat protein (TIGR04138 family)
MLDPKHPLAELLRRDKRYHFDAYVFVFDALRFGQERLGLGDPPSFGVDSEIDSEIDSELEAALEDSELDGSELDDSELDDDEVERHVTGQELCFAIQQYAVDRFGLLARSVLAHWGIHRTGDFGEIVFNLIGIGQMRKTDSDRREDFDDVYDFAEAFNEEVVFASASGDSEE